MAAVVNRASRQALLKAKSINKSQKANFGNLGPTGKKVKLGALGLAAGGAALAAGVAYNGAVHANTELVLEPPHFPWPTGGMLNDYDKRSVKRGYEVFKQVCSACHSMNYLRFREMVGVIFSRDEAKKEATEFQVLDGPDREGNMFRRPGMIIDSLPSPYDNEEAAKAANNGVAPPDLTYFAKASGPDYIFSLLTGYVDPPPAGVVLGEGVHYNPYYEGGLIAMQQALYDDIIEYEDGTPATQAQLAKDVTTFIMWAGEPEYEVRKRAALKYSLCLLAFTASIYYYKRLKWAPIRSNRMILKNLLEGVRSKPQLPPKN